MAVSQTYLQRSPSFELRGSLSLAKLYHANGRDADAHAALSPALEGFRRRRKCPRSPRHRRCWQRLHNNLMREGFRARPITVLVNGRRPAAEW